MRKYMGAVEVGDYVLYFRNADTTNIKDYKKDIWKVEEIIPATDISLYSNVEIKNITRNSSFTTSINNLIQVNKLLLEYNLEDIVAKRSIAKWRDTGVKIEYTDNSGFSDPTCYKRIIGTDKEGKPIFNKTPYEDAFSIKGGTFKGSPYWEKNKNACAEIRLDGADAIRYGIIYEDKQSGDDEMNMINSVVSNNVDAAKAGAVISAGNTLNKVVKNSVRGQVPRKYRKILDSPVGDVVVANVASFAVQNFAKTNKKARVAANAMMQAAMVEVLNSFNLDQMIADVLANANFDEILDTTGQ